MNWLEGLIGAKKMRDYAVWVGHECPVVDVGAVGGRFTFHITPLSIGTVVKVQCVCGSTIDLTDVEGF